MTTFKNILVYVDTTHTAAHTGVEWAAHLAAQHNGKITLLDVVEEAPWYLGADGRAAAEEEERKQRETVLTDVSESLRERGVGVDIVVRVGAAHTSIIKEAVQGSYDVVVKTMMRGDTSGRLFGSVAQRLLRKCPCPVLLVKADAHPPVRRIVAAVDPNPGDAPQNVLNRKVLDTAAAFPREAGEPVTAVHAWTMYGEAMYASRHSAQELEARFVEAEERISAALRELLEEAADENGPLAAQLVHGDPEEAIPMFLSKEEIDLLVIGTMARAGVAGLIVGNTAENILDNVSCSVLALKPDDFACPINLDA